MSNASKRSKKTEVSRLLREIGEALTRAGQKTIAVAQVVKDLEAAVDKMEKAAQWAKPTTIQPIPSVQYEGKTKKDGLPAPVRQAIMREASHVTKLLARVKALPVSQDERLLATRQRAKAKRR